MPKGALIRFEQQNNAIRFACEGEPGYYREIDVFGDLKAPAHDTESRFTTAWRQLGLSMRNDVAHHPSWPASLQKAGYPIMGSVGADPGFKDPFRGDFTLEQNSICRGVATVVTVRLPDDSSWSSDAGGHIGAWQEDALFAGPEFVTSSVLLR